MQDLINYLPLHHQLITHFTRKNSTKLYYLFDKKGRLSFKPSMHQPQLQQMGEAKKKGKFTAKIRD